METLLIRVVDRKPVGDHVFAAVLAISTGWLKKCIRVFEL